FAPIILLNEHACQLTALAFSPDGHLIACADSQDTVHVWDGLEHHRFEGHQGPVAGLTFSVDGLTLASGGTDGIIRLWKWPQGNPACQGEKSGCTAKRSAFAPARTSMALSPTGSELAHCHYSTLRIWDTATAKARFHSAGAGSFQSLAYSSDGHWLAAVTDSAIDLWDTPLGEFRIRLEDDHLCEPVTALAFCPGSLTLASAGATSMAIWIWDVQEEEPSLLIPDALDGCTVLALAFQPHGHLLAAGGIDWLATGGSNGAVSLWDLEKRCEVMTFSLGALCLAFHPSSRWLASGTLEKSICIWDLVEQQLTAELMGHEDTVNCVAYSPDGRWLASGSDDRTLCIWDAGTGKLLARKALNTQIKTLAFAQDRTSLFTANGNNTCYCLQLPASLLNRVNP